MRLVPILHLQEGEMSFLQHQNHTAERLDIEHTWNTLRQGLADIYETVSVPRERYMQLYNLVYQYCTSNHLTLPAHSRSFLPGCELLGKILYNNLQDFLRQHLHNLVVEGQRESRDEKLLAFYQTSWNNYVFSSMVVHHVFLYMNRHWVRRAWEDGDNDVLQVYSLAMVMWRENLLTDLQGRVTEAVLRLITKERNGDPINTLLVSCVKQTYVDMGVSKHKQKHSKLDYYKKHLEVPILYETRHYYTLKSSAFLLQHSVAEYVQKALVYLSEEKRRVERYLHENSMDALIDTCKDVLIVQHLPRLYEEFQVYLNTDRDHDDMAALFELIDKTENGLEKMEQIFENHVLKAGLGSVEGNCVVESAVGVGSDAEIYIKAILAVYRKYKQLVLMSFKNHQAFVKAFDTACQRFINHNAVTDRATSSSKSAELVARYCDQLLRRRSSSELSQETDELEETMTDIMTVFHYLESKDVFQKFYRCLLAKRLVERRSVSEDAEATMISKLKTSGGSLYTSSLQKMFQDMAVSSELNSDFMKHVQVSNTSFAVEFHVDVLTHGSWPFQQMPLCFALPTDLESCIEQFKLFYSVYRSSRKLIWLYHRARAEIVTNCFRRRYTMIASIYQVAVLLQYNRRTSYTIRELQANTQISHDELQQVLSTLLKIRLLFYDNTFATATTTTALPSSSLAAAAAVAAANEPEVCAGAGKDSEELTLLPPDAVCHLFHDYKHRKTRVDINVPLRSVERRELDATHRSVNDERRYLIEAAIIRVMKTKQRLSHHELVAQTIAQLSTRFSADSRTLKTCIDDLINRDYLRRCEQSNNTYLYVA